MARLFLDEAKGSYFETIGGSFNQSVGVDSRIKIDGKSSRHAKGDAIYDCDSNQTVHAKGDLALNADGKWGGKGTSVKLVAESKMELTAQGWLVVNGAFVTVEATVIQLKCPGSFIRIDPSGVTIKGPQVRINSGGETSSGPCAPEPALASLAAPAAALKPGETKTTENPAGSGAAGGGENTHDENAEENKDKTHWIEAELKDESGAPVIGEPCEITLPDGKKATRSTDTNGLVRVNKIDVGDCKIRWIQLDQDAVSK